MLQAKMQEQAPALTDAELSEMEGRATEVWNRNSCGMKSVMDFYNGFWSQLKELSTDNARLLAAVRRLRQLTAQV